MEWKRETVLKFIKLMKERPAIWDTQSPEYKLKIKRNDALEEMSMLMGISSRDVLAKWISLKNQFSREKRKMTGSGADSVYMTKWYAYWKLVPLLSSTILPTNNSLLRNHDVPFYVAAPLTSIDMALTSGERIKIEERPDREMTNIGEHRIAAPGINCWNPSFDEKPASLITGIINENGVFARDTF